VLAGVSARADSSLAMAVAIAMAATSPKSATTPQGPLTRLSKSPEGRSKTRKVIGRSIFAKSRRESSGAVDPGGGNTPVGERCRHHQPRLALSDLLTSIFTSRGILAAGWKMPFLARKFEDRSSDEDPSTDLVPRSSTHDGRRHRR
jgi:hypothetical protein